MYLFTVISTSEFINGSLASQTAIFPANYPCAYFYIITSTIDVILTMHTYVDLRANNRYSIPIPVIRGSFYTFSILVTNVNNLTAFDYSPQSDSVFAACMFLQTKYRYMCK